MTMTMSTSMNIIMTTTMKNVDADTTMSMTMNMNIIMTTTMKNVDADMTMNMNIITTTTMKNVDADMTMSMTIITTTTMKNVDADTTMSIIITIMQMKCSQAGAKRRQRNIQKKEFMRFWKHSLTIMMSTEWYCVQKVW